MRATWNGFRSPLASHIEQYLATKRALGCKFASEDRMLRLLDRFLVEQRIGSMNDISGECLEQFLASRERVNKAIAAFIRLGWIQQIDRRYVITNRRQLEIRAR